MLAYTVRAILFKNSKPTTNSLMVRKLKESLAPNKTQPLLLCQKLSHHFRNLGLAPAVLIIQLTDPSRTNF